MQGVKDSTSGDSYPSANGPSLDLTVPFQRWFVAIFAWQDIQPKMMPIKSALNEESGAFKPRGSESALRTAVAVLVAELNQKVQGPRGREKKRKLAGVTERLDLSLYPDEVQACRSIGADYLSRIHDDENAIRLGDFFDRLNGIRDHSVELASLLSGLTKEARFLLETFHGVDAATFDRLGKLQEEMGELLSSESQGSGAFVKQLRALSKYTELYGPFLRKRLGGRASGPIDRGGRTNILRLSTPSPAWELITSSWDLFGQYSHLKPASSPRGDLHDFIRSIHHWATGDSRRNYSKALAKLASYKLKQRTLSQRLHNLRTTHTNCSAAEFNAALKKNSSHSGKVPSSVVRTARKIQRELDQLEDQLHFGWQPKRR